MSQSEDGEKLLAAVLAAPEDDALRLVYADWLQERDDARGEFISLQCEIARLGRGASSVRMQLLKTREQRLLEEYGEEWSSPIREVEAALKMNHHPDRSEITFVRGFIETFAPHRAALFLAAAPSLFRREPVVSVRLHTMKKEEAGPFGECPQLAGVRRLAARGGSWDLAADELVEAIARSPFTGRIDQLELRSVLHGASKSLEVLAGSALAPNLRLLNLSGNMNSAGMAEIIASGSFDRLRSLDLSGNAMSDSGAIALAQSGGLRAVEHLLLAGNYISEAGAMALAASAAFPNLKSLDLKKNGITASKGGNALRESYPFVAL